MPNEDIKFPFEILQFSNLTQFSKQILARINIPVNTEKTLIAWFLVKKKLNIYLGMQSNWEWLKILYFKIYIKCYFLLKGFI